MTSVSVSMQIMQKIHASFHTKSTKKDISNPTPSALDNFLRGCSPNGDLYSCQTLLLYGHQNSESRHQKVSKSLSFLDTSCLRQNGITSALIETQSSLYVHFKANKMSFPMICYNIFTTVMFPRSSNSTYDIVFLKQQYFKVFNILCAHYYYLKHLLLSRLHCSGIRVCKVFSCEQSLHSY